MAGITPSLSRQQLYTIAWLRWRLFVNTLRGKRAMGELAVKFITYPLLGIMVIGPSIGAGFFAYSLINRGMDEYLAIPLWIIFAVWQAIGVSTSAAGPSFDLSTLTRFPIRYRDYLLVRLSFGLLDPPTFVGIACLIGTGIGITIAAPALFPWAAITLSTYAVCNILFSRMIYSWLERWLAQRRTRELVTVLILLFSLGVQVASQFLQRIGGTGHRHGAPGPLVLKTADFLIAINWWLPPGLAASVVRQAHAGLPLLGLAAFGGLILYTVAFLLIFHIRMHAQYLGENLGEAPAARIQKSKTTILSAQPNAASVPEKSAHAFAFLPATVAACLVKEIRYLLRSGPRLYSLIIPVFMVFLFSARSAGMSEFGLPYRASTTGYLFVYGCVYTQLLFVAFLYNSFGTDATGVQSYFLAPIRIREVVLAKNLMTGGIMVIEVVLIYIATAVISTPPPLDITAATLAWVLFAFFLNMSIGNIRSLVSPKVVEPGKIRRQNVSALSSFISLGVVLGAAALGALVLSLCRSFESIWLASIILLAFAAISFGIYLFVYRKLDSIAAKNLDDLTRELCKT